MFNVQKFDFRPKESLPVFSILGIRIFFENLKQSLHFTFQIFHIY